MITQQYALQIIEHHYSNTHDELGISMINFYAELGAHPKYRLSTLRAWLGY